VVRAPRQKPFVTVLAVFVAAWTILWIVLGVVTWHEVRTLHRLSTTVVKSGFAVQQTGNALQGLRAIPFVGGDVARIGRQVTAAGIDARRSGHASASAVDNLATLLGIAIAIVPTVPMLVLLAVTLWLVRRPEPAP